MKKTIINLVLLAFLIILISSAPKEDQVEFKIPNYVNHKWYSGYLNISTGHYHYIFFDSQRDPDNDPLVLWLNGGPGCSSLIGMTLQNGPFVFQRNKTNFLINDNAWNKRANVIYLQSPGGVGFSKSFTNNTYTDATVAEDNYRALTDFFRKFPNLKKNDFFISGESYAGIYIPHLAKKILEKNKLPNTQTIMNLKGILIGNPCTNPRQCFERDYQTGPEGSMSIYQYQQLYYHNHLTDSQYQRIRGSCTLGYLSAGCVQIRKIVDGLFANTLTSINNLYQPCYHQTIPNVPQPVSLQSGRSLKDFETCDDLKGIYHFFNEPLMHVYLHVDPVKFQICSDQVSQKYTMFSNGSTYLYPELIKSNIRIWVYSGDIDANVPITGTLKWIQLMKDVEGIPVMEPWREWWVPGLHKHEDQMAGMVWKLRGFTFVSVKGAGHMVPADKPRQAQVLFESFISGNDLPEKSL